ncbi:hypothetical protein M0804_002676 [Polistes exclamans]|nr:hypothetical protein M0804_002676 [Polistes exclamans]
MLERYDTKRHRSSNNNENDDEEEEEVDEKRRWWCYGTSICRPPPHSNAKSQRRNVESSHMVRLNGLLDNV